MHPSPFLTKKVCNLLKTKITLNILSVMSYSSTSHCVLYTPLLKKMYLFISFICYFVIVILGNWCDYVINITTPTQLLISALSLRE